MSERNLLPGKFVWYEDPADDHKIGHFFWNELHTTAAAKALTFCQKVLGFSHRAMDMGPGGVYNILSQGDVDRGGVTTQLEKGMTSHWLPYVFVEDPDAAIGRAKKLGATIAMAPSDIPGVGLFAIFQDPTGAALAIMKPKPMEKQPAA